MFGNLTAVISKSSGEKRPRVLLIDDDQGVSRSLSRLLSRHVDVVAVYSALEAEAKLKEGEQYDFLLCDLLLPEKTGLDFYRDLCSQDPSYRHRLAFMTGLGPDEPMLRSCPEVPCLGKPFDLKEALRLVHDSTQQAEERCCEARPLGAEAGGPLSCSCRSQS